MTRFIDAHVHPPVAEFFDGPVTPFLAGLERTMGFTPTPMEPAALVDYYRSRDARAVLWGWDSETTTNRRPLGSSDIASLVGSAPDVFIGLGAVDPSKGAAAVGQIHEAARLGLHGISLHSAAQGLSPAERTVFPVWEAAAGHDLICAFHTGSTILGAGTAGGTGVRLESAHPLHIDSIAARFPDLRVALVHEGTLWLDEAVAVAEHKSNVYLCLGGQSPAALSAGVIAAIAGPLQDRTIFGSGYPFAEPDVWIGQWDRIDIPESLRMKVLYDNALELFGEVGAG